MATPVVRAAIARERRVVGLRCIVGPFIADGIVADRCGGVLEVEWGPARPSPV
jgi:hypothetical protein